MVSIIYPVGSSLFEKNRYNNNSDDKAGIVVSDRPQQSKPRPSYHPRIHVSVGLYVLGRCPWLGTFFDFNIDLGDQCNCQRHKGRLLRLARAALCRGEKDCLQMELLVCHQCEQRFRQHLIMAAGAKGPIFVIDPRHLLSREPAAQDFVRTPMKFISVLDQPSWANLGIFAPN